MTFSTNMDELQFTVSKRFKGFSQNVPSLMPGSCRGDLCQNGNSSSSFTFSSSSSGFFAS